MQGQSCAIGVMAKAPVPGRAKTRLTPLVRAEDAAALSAAFLRDVTENVQQAAREQPIHGYVAFAPAATEHLFDGHLAEGTRLVLADGSPALPPQVQGFGRSLLHAIQSMLADGHGAAIVLNSDSPNLPTAFLVRAAALLLEKPNCVVLGPAEDGGYYLLGMTAPHAGLFEDVAWSTETVAADTRGRAHALGLELIELPTWYDVDAPEMLLRLIDDLAAPTASGSRPYPAATTAACLATIEISRARLTAAQ